MKFEIKTVVNGNYKEVMKKFDIDLFKALKPPIGKMKIIEFTGSKKGDLVHLQFLSPLKMEWISKIVADGIDENKAFFIDEGAKLPNGLKYWKHKHIVERKTANTATIIDSITFKGSNILVESFLYPILYSSFLMRRPAYKKYFNQ